MVYINTTQILEPRNQPLFTEIEDWFKNNNSDLFKNNNLRLLILSQDDASREACSVFYSDYIVFSDPNDLIIYLANNGSTTWDEETVSIIEGIQYV